jgi:hypothetical protein
LCFKLADFSGCTSKFFTDLESAGPCVSQQKRVVRGRAETSIRHSKQMPRGYPVRYFYWVLESQERVSSHSFNSSLAGTFSKQLKLIHGGGFSPEEKAVYRRIVHQHLSYAIEQLKAIMGDSPEVKLSPSNHEALESLPEEVEITPDTAHLIRAM